MINNQPNQNQNQQQTNPKPRFRLKTWQWGMACVAHYKHYNAIAIFWQIHYNNSAI